MNKIPARAKVLVIDDDPILCAAVKVMLRRYHYKVFDADNATTGLELARRENPDLILCDYHLRFKDGLEMLSDIRKDTLTASIPFIVTTGDKNIVIQRRSMEEGADDFIIKPFTEDDLVSAIESRLNRSAEIKARIEQTNYRLLKLLEDANEMIAIVDPQKVEITYLNHAARRMTGFEHASKTHTIPLQNLYPPRFIEKIIVEAIPHALNTGNWSGDAEIVNQKGGTLWVKQKIVVHRHSDSSLDFMSITAHEISEIRQAEEQLRQLSRAVAQSPVSIVITDIAGNIEYVNPKFTQVSGYSLQEALGKNPKILKSGKIADEVYAELWKTILSGKEWQGDLLNKRKNGDLFWEQVLITNIVDDQGTITHFLAIKEDITDRKKAEKERLALETQLQQAQKLESIGRLAAGIAHEINTPTQYVGDNIHFIQKALGDLERVLESHKQLVSIVQKLDPPATNMLEVLKPVQKVRIDYLRAEIPKAISDALEGLNRVTKIVRAMKDFSHPGVEEKKPVDLNRSIESTITISRNEWKYVAEMVMELDPSLPLVPCIPGEFNQVILNLVVNAAHAIADVVGDGQTVKGTITVSTRQEGNMAVVRIKDTGTGIPEKIRNRMFEPFFTTKQVGKGTGQGLALSRSVIVDRHGGTIHFESECGKGTTFIIRLPIQSSYPPKA